MVTRTPTPGLTTALNSLLTQTHDLLTLTLVIDGPEPELERSLQAHPDPRLKILPLPRQQGFISALNLALQHSKPATFMAIVYPDCFYAPDFLQILLSTLLRHPGAGGAYCATHLGAPNKQHPLLVEPEYRQTELLSRNFLGPGVLFRYEIFQQAGAIFVSEKQGLWETWKRMSLHKPFISVAHALIRRLPEVDAHSASPPYLPQPEQDILPFLHLRCLILDRSSVDSEFLLLLQNGKHELLHTPPSQGIPDLIIFGSLLHLEQACRLAEKYFIPALLVTNEESDLAQLYYQQRIYLRTLAFASATREVIQRLKQIDGQETVRYFPDMKLTDFHRQLSQIPLLLTRYRTTLLIRAYAQPFYLKNTLQWLNQLSHPPDWGQILIICPEAPQALTDWLKQQNYTWYVPNHRAYFPELLYLLQQMKTSLVLGIDAGVLIPPEWFLKTLPYLRNPRVGMVSSLLHNSEIPEQRLPFALQSLPQFEKQWRRYSSQTQHPPVTAFPLLSDGLFLMRRHLLERVLMAGPQVLPLGYHAVLSHLLTRLGHPCLLTRDTAAFNLLM